MSSTKEQVQQLIEEHDLIQYRDFDTPSWDNYQRRKKGWKRDIGLYHFGGAKDDWGENTKTIKGYVISQTYHEYIKVLKDFPYTKQGYADFCNWLNEQKRLMAEQACR